MHYNRIRKREGMISQSKLMLQLSKEQKLVQKSNFNQQYYEQLYSTICKLEPKNLMLVEFLTLVIEKDLIKNSNKMAFFIDLFQQVKGKALDQDHSHINKNPSEVEEQKFNKKKFLKLLKDLARKLFPGYPHAYETILFDKITLNGGDQHRIKIDQNVKKYLTKQTVSALTQFQKEFQTIFQIFMPENYNLGLGFSWQEIRLLQKKLPIISLFRFLNEAEICPHIITGPQVMEIISKLKPPASPTSSSKQAMFYTSQTITTYMREYVNLPAIKLIEGDVGITFFQFQILFIRIACEFGKDGKNDFPSYIRKMIGFTKVREIVTGSEDCSQKKMRLYLSVHNHLTSKESTAGKISIKKRQSRKKIEELYDAKDAEMKEESMKVAYNNMAISVGQIESMKKNLDDQLPELPVKRKIQKENEGFFDVEQKHIIIGQQLPKLQEKAKVAAPKGQKKKNEDALLGFKPEVEKTVEQSPTVNMIKRQKKIRINNEFPIVLNEIFYPSTLKSPLPLGNKAEIYLQTSYIHLGERLYEEAYVNYSKAVQLADMKNPLVEFYFHVHAAQIFQSAGKDDLALLNYYKAKDSSLNLPPTESAAKAFAYIGIGSCLYHLEEYQYALRCFEKARQVYGLTLQVQSIDNAILQNNIGCCYMMLNRNQEAIKPFTISHQILDLKVGRFDERALVVQQNGAKNRKAHLEMMPEFKTMWKTYVEKTSGKPIVKSAAGKPKK